MPAYAGLAALVARLQALGVNVPTCWHSHGSLVARLAALAARGAAAYAPGATPAAPRSDGPSGWWGSSATVIPSPPTRAATPRRTPLDDPGPIPALAAFVPGRRPRPRRARPP
ncbi:MAG TPA: hypothetical protein VMW47_12260 [Verrucomicrobiae bacterium]|nr:hypothetical protein [Verrucomicrobiae bacterium]